MFSGIIDRTGIVRSAEAIGGSLRLRLATGYDDLQLGESVAVNGVCLTVTALADGGTDFFVSPETLARTNLGGLAVDVPVNLERAVRLDTRLSGHLVQGHVDGSATLASAVAERGAHRLAFVLEAGLARFCVTKGSIALDGVSLTINRLDGDRIDLTLIPHSWASTTMHRLSPGDRVNVEVDMIAKYVERLCKPYLKP